MNRSNHRLYRLRAAPGLETDHVHPLVPYKAREPSALHRLTPALRVETGAGKLSFDGETAEERSV